MRVGPGSVFALVMNSAVNALQSAPAVWDLLKPAVPASRCTSASTSLRFGMLISDPPPLPQCIRLRCRPRAPISFLHQPTRGLLFYYYFYYFGEIIVNNGCAIYYYLLLFYFYFYYYFAIILTYFTIILTVTIIFLLFFCYFIIISYYF